MLGITYSFVILKLDIEFLYTYVVFVEIKVFASRIIPVKKLSCFRLYYDYNKQINIVDCILKGFGYLVNSF